LIDVDELATLEIFRFECETIVIGSQRFIMEVCPISNRKSIFRSVL